MHPLARRVLRFVRSQSLVLPGGRVIAALSGGADSVALAHLLAELDAAGALKLDRLAHLNHRLRGEEADADEIFCREVAERLARPIEVARVDVRARAVVDKRSIEDAGRAVRYEFLERLRAGVGADSVAVGHTRDDQAETLLLRLFRGAGPRGLAGIYPANGAVVRPLLDITRAELREYLGDRDVSFREDASNQDRSIPRNRIRHELLPYLEKYFSPAVVDVLARAATVAREDADWLDRAAEQVFSTVVTPAPNGVTVDAAALRSLPRALGRRVTRAALEAGAGGRFIGFEHVSAVLALADDERARPLDLPGQRATRSASSIRLSMSVLGPRQRSGPLTCRGDIRAGRSEHARSTRGVEPAPARWPLPVPGSTVIEPLGIEILAELVGRDRRPLEQGPSGRGPAAAIAAEVAGPLAVRTRQPGDRLQPLGLGGRKKLQDLLVDRKVPREERDRVPLVVDGADRIVWVVGHAIADVFRVTADTQAVIILSVRCLGGG